MLTGFAVLSFKEASAGRRPHRQRAYGVVHLVLAGYLLVHAVRIASRGW